MNLPGFVAVLFRRTGPQLEQNHIVKIRQEMPPEAGVYQETKKTYTFGNGSMLIFKHLEHEHDVDDIQGWEIHWAGVDEAGQCTPYQLEYIKTRLRISEELKEKWVKLGKQAYVDRLPRCVFSANPGGESHHYLKNRFIDPAKPETVFNDPHTRDEANPLDKGALTQFIPSTLEDNKYLGAEYRRQFSGLPDWQKKMLRDGDWNVVAGAFFDCWNTRKHAIRPFKVPEHWNHFRAMDYGFATPFWVGWFAVSDGSPVREDGTGYPQGALICYREWYGSKTDENGQHTNSGLRMDPFEVGKRISLAERQEHVSYGVCDPSAWRVDTGVFAAEKMGNGGAVFGKADNKRIAGWQEVYSRLDNDLLFFFDDCTEIIRTLPTVMRAENDPEDVEKKGEDHAPDGLRYACMSRPYEKKKTKTLQEITAPLTMNDLMKINKLPRIGV